MNDEILANTDAYLRAHLCSHYDWEALKDGGNMVCRYPPQQWSEFRCQLSEECHGSLQGKLSRALRWRAGAQGLDVNEAQ